MGQTTLFLFAFNAILVYNKMNYMLVQENKEKGEMMLAEMKEIILIIEEFCIDNCIVILACTNALALLLAVICLVRTSKKKHTKRNSDESEEMLLNLIPIEAKKIETEEFYTSRSGKVYSEEEIQSQIRD